MNVVEARNIFHMGSLNKDLMRMNAEALDKFFIWFFSSKYAKGLSELSFDGSRSSDPARKSERMVQNWVNIFIGETADTAIVSGRVYKAQFPVRYFVPKERVVERGDLQVSGTVIWEETGSTRVDKISLFHFASNYNVTELSPDQLCGHLIGQKKRQLEKLESTLKESLAVRR